MIGLNLSLCVQDIANGKVDESQVEKIIAGTCARNAGDFAQVVISYNRTYWSDLPQARKIALRLWKEGKIDQPRLRGEEARNIAEGHWLVNGHQTNF